MEIDDILNACKAIEKLDTDKIEHLAKVFEKLNKQTADKIRKEGLPKLICVNPEVSPIFKEAFAGICDVKANELLSKNTVLLFWEDPKVDLHYNDEDKSLPFYKKFPYHGRFV